MNAEIRYERALVSFVDILGFKNLLETANAQEVLNVLTGKETLSGERRILSDQTTTFSFSDLIVNVTPLNADSERHLYVIFDQMQNLGFKQFLLATSGIFVRGGITIGNIYAKDQTIFGPALVKAYELEVVTAKWPIIAIDPDLVQRIENESPHYLRKCEEKLDYDGRFCGKAFLGYLSSIIRKTPEHSYFLDYIACMAYEDTTTGDLRYYLSDHKEAVVQAYTNYRNWKYEFIARYHDDRCRDYFPQEHNLQIGGLVERDEERQS